MQKLSHDQVILLLSFFITSLHSIPAMPTEVEWVFGSSKIPIDRRNCLRDAVICPIECLQQSWEKVGIVEVAEVSMLEEMLQALKQPELSNKSGTGGWMFHFEYFFVLYSPRQYTLAFT
jgi:hypothetical protein